MNCRNGNATISREKSIYSNTILNIIDSLIKYLFTIILVHYYNVVLL